MWRLLKNLILKEELETRTRKPTTPRYITEGRAREVANEMVSTAIREQARDLEEYLRDIHKRLIALEKK